MSNDLLTVNQKLYEAWAKPDALRPNLWKARYARILDGPWYADFDQYNLAMENPYYAVVNATAFCLEVGNFRGYEHFASIFFKPDSKYHVGVTVHRERTRTHIAEGNYVTDWYVSVTKPSEANEHEQMYRAAVGILVTCELPAQLSTRLRKFTAQNKLNIRIKGNADQKAQISSQG